MKNLIASAVFIAMTLIAGSIQAQSEETGVVANIFACNFNEGKTTADSKSARDFFVDVIAEIGSPELSAMISFLWWPHTGSFEVDALWFDYHANLNAYGKATDAYWESDYVAGTEALFANVSTCSSSLHFQRQVYTGGELEVSIPAAIQAYRCSFNPGRDMEDVEEALEDWSEVNRGLGNTEMDAYMFAPIVNSSPYDVAYFNVFANWSDYSAVMTRYLTSEVGQEMDARWLDIHSCENSLWNGERIIPPIE